MFMPSERVLFATTFTNSSSDTLLVLPPHEYATQTLARALLQQPENNDTEEEANTEVLLRGKNTGDSLAFFSRIVVDGVAGIGCSAVVVRSSEPQRPLFALKIQPAFYRTAAAGEQSLLPDKSATRELLTLSRLRCFELYERRILGRRYGEMTLHTVRMLTWGRVHCSLGGALRGFDASLQAIPLHELDEPAKRKARQRLSELSSTRERTWQYIAMELVQGGSGQVLAHYVLQLAARDPSGQALTSFLRCMCAQLAAQLVMLKRALSIEHLDLHVNNVFWVSVPLHTRIHYLLPDDLPMVVPLADTAPLGALADTPVAQGNALLFKIGDWGMSASPGDGYGPRTSYDNGGEFADTSFYEKYDWTLTLDTLMSALRQLDPSFCWPTPVQRWHDALTDRRVEETARQQRIEQHKARLPCVVASAAIQALQGQEWAGSSTMLFEVFGGDNTRQRESKTSSSSSNALSLFLAPYCHGWHDNRVPTDTGGGCSILMARYVPLAR